MRKILLCLAIAASMAGCQWIEEGQARPPAPPPAAGCGKAECRCIGCACSRDVCPCSKNTCGCCQTSGASVKLEDL